MIWNYTINPESEEPIMLINQHIGYDYSLGMGVVGAQFQAELLALDDMGKRRVQVWINSLGGSVMDGYNICSAILNTKCKVDTYCRGIAASIAGVIFMCGRTKYMADYGIFMAHDPEGSDHSEALSKIKNSLATLIAARSGKQVETICAIMARETFMDASEAIDMGVCDEIELSTDTNKGRLAPVRNDAKAFYGIANSILNKVIIKTEDTTMSDLKSINNRLGLNPDANPGSTMREIAAIENKAKEADSKLKEVQNSLTASETSLNSVKNELKEKAAVIDSLKEENSKIKSDLDAFKKEAEKKELENVKNSAKDLVTLAVKDGRIKNDASLIEKWTNRLVADFAGTKELIDEMTINKEAADINNAAAAIATDPANPFKGVKNYASVDDRDAHVKLMIQQKETSVKENLKIK